MTSACRLRDLLAQRTATIIPGCNDAIGARLSAEAGYPALYVPGFSVAASLGLLDIGVMTIDDMAGRVAAIASSTDLPVIVDAEAGYGTISNVAQTVRRYERAGAAGLHLEDQVTPKLASDKRRRLIPVADMQAKIAAAVAARKHSDFVIIARTDAVESEGGLSEAIHRACACIEAGADGVLVKFLTRIADVHTVVSTVTCPVLVAQGETVRPTLSMSALRQTGCSLVLFTLSLTLASAAAQRDMLSLLRSEDDIGEQLTKMMALSELNDAIGHEKVVSWERSVLERVANFLPSNTEEPRR